MKNSKTSAKAWKKMAFSVMIMSIFMLSVYTSEAVAVHGRIWPATIIMNPSVRIFESTTGSSYVEVTNLDTASADVFIEPNVDLNDYVDINTPYFFLEPGQTANVTFDIAVKDALQHTGDLFITFKDTAVTYSYFVSLRIYPVATGTVANTQSPTAPTGLSPRADYCTRDVTVSWTASTDSDTPTVVYQFELDNNNDFASRKDTGVIVGTDHKFHLEPGLYFWRIRAYDGKQYSAWASSSFKINDPLECMDRMAQLEQRITQLESRFNVLENLVNAIKAGVCTLGTFQFCSGTPTQCAGSDTECGLGGICQNCNLLDGCYSGLYRNYGCSSQSCEYTSSCTEACCDALYQNASAYCSSGVCNAPPTGGSCTNECTSGQTRCSGNYSQTCGNYDQDSCTEWNTGTLCANGCLNGACQQACVAKGGDCTVGSDCCSGTCSFTKTCTAYDIRGICSRYTYKWTCQ